MIVLMNGYTSRQASMGIDIYFLGAVAVALLAGMISIGAGLLPERRFDWNMYLSASISTIVSILIGAIGLRLGVFVSLVVTEMSRTGGWNG